jgi:hypothetical protein
LKGDDRVRTCAFTSGVTLLSLCFGGCTPKHEKNWHKLSVGMDRLEVREQLGEPTSRIGPARGVAATRPMEVLVAAIFLGEAYELERWAYGPRGFFGGLSNLFGPSHRAHVVYFDRDRHVLRWRKPVPEDSPLARGGRANEDVVFQDFVHAMVVDDRRARPVRFVPTGRPVVYPAPTALTARPEGNDLVTLEWTAPADLPPWVEYVVVLILPDGRVRTASSMAPPLPTTATAWSPSDVNLDGYPFVIITEDTRVRIVRDAIVFTHWFVRVVDPSGVSEWSEPAPLPARVTKQ